LAKLSSPSMQASIRAVRPQQSGLRTASGALLSIRFSSRRFLRYTAVKMSTSPRLRRQCRACRPFHNTQCKATFKGGKASYAMKFHDKRRAVVLPPSFQTRLVTRDPAASRIGVRPSPLLLAFS
jgi:hypothetical protein